MVKTKKFNALLLWTMSMVQLTDQIHSLIFFSVIIASTYFILFYWKKTSVYTVTRLRQSNVVRTTTKCLLARSLWISKLFIELANDNEKNNLHLTVVELIKIDLIGLEQRLIIPTNRFVILMAKITIKCVMFLRVLE